jgi:hypothetical protein
MATFNLKQVPVQSDLHRVIEPLASYICAADQPRAALLSALAVLLAEVKQTNRAALAQFGVHLGAFAEGR